MYAWIRAHKNKHNQINGDVNFEAPKIGGENNEKNVHYNPTESYSGMSVKLQRVLFLVVRVLNVGVD